jgi:hypothetical protein
MPLPLPMLLMLLLSKPSLPVLSLPFNEVGAVIRRVDDCIGLDKQVIAQSNGMPSSTLGANLDHR